MIESVLIAFSLCFINITAALIVIKYAYKRKKEKLIATVLTSMIIRYVIITVAVWFCFKILELNQLAFSLTFFITTFILIIVEILYLNNRSNFLNLQNHLNK
jgi:hypothetical protein